MDTWLEEDIDVDKNVNDSKNINTNNNGDIEINKFIQSNQIKNSINNNDNMSAKNKRLFGPTCKKRSDVRQK